MLGNIWDLAGSASAPASVSIVSFRALHSTTVIAYSQRRRYAANSVLPYDNLGASMIVYKYVHPLIFACLAFHRNV
jgi:hypothetical protein